MRLIIEISREIAEKIGNLVKTGKFNSLPEFVQIAIHNQLLLEESHKGEFELSVTPKPIGELPFQTTSPVSRPVISTLLNIREQGYDEIEVMPSPSTDNLEPGPLWGQYNRIFPVKVIVRALANLMIQTGGPMGLSDFGNLVSEIARFLGYQLRDLDKVRRKGAGEKLAIALPIGSDPYKSKSRFTSQFIGYIDSRERIIGAAPKLGLVNIFDTKLPRIGITEAGLKFALIANPILDEIPQKDVTLSVEEVEYYLMHVKEFLPVEAEIMDLVVQHIDKGDNSPEALREVVSNFDPSLTVSQADTIRGGLVGRLSELDLISIVRSGRKITYELTAVGRDKIDSMGG
jgi:hypothetical protein